MNMNKSSLKLLAVLAAAAAAGGAWAPAFGSSLTSIGVLNPALPTSVVYALSQDGIYAVGYSRTTQLFFSGVGTNVPVVWSAAGGLVELSCPSGKNTSADGVAIGQGANSGFLLISAAHEGTAKTRRFTRAPLTALNSTGWTDAGQYDGTGTSTLTGSGFAMSRADYSNADGRWYLATQKGNRYHRTRVDPVNAYDDGTGDNTTATSMSCYGCDVGLYKGSSTDYRARWQLPPSTWGDVPSIAGAGSRVWGQGISASFGAANNAVQWICGQIDNYWTNSVPTKFPQAFRWNRADTDLTPLGSLFPAGGGDVTLQNNSSTAYCVADNGVTAGRSYDGTGTGDVATVWDTSGTWDNTGAPKNLKDLLTADGVDTSAWTKLADVYACSDDGKVLAGYGVRTDGSSQGFVAVKSGTALPVVHITNISWGSPNVVITFTSSNTADATGQFTLQKATPLINAGTVFTDVGLGLGITGSGGTYQATFAPTANPQFYRIKRTP